MSRLDCKSVKVSNVIVITVIVTITVKCMYFNTANVSNVIVITVIVVITVKCLD